MRNHKLIRKPTSPIATVGLSSISVRRTRIATNLNIIPLDPPAINCDSIISVPLFEMGPLEFLFKLMNQHITPRKSPGNPDALIESSSQT